MKIVDYIKKEMGDDIINLFSSISPNWTMDEVKRMAYDENTPLHVSTKVSIIDDKIVGQANVFRLSNNSTIANIGYHVHPYYQRKGIGIALASAVMEKAKGWGIKTIVVQTETSNKAALNLAKKLGFKKPSKTFLEKKKVD